MSTIQEVRDEVKVLSGKVQTLVDSVGTITSQNAALTAENQSLKDQLANVIDPADLDSVVADVKAIEAIIPGQS